MCGRYYVDEESNQELLKIIRNLDKRLQTAPSSFPHRVKSGEIYPSDTVPIITQQGTNPIYDAMTWGFSNPRNKSLIINARQESVNEKPMFSKAIKDFRIVIPASGFFEWSHNESKQKYYFTDPDSPTLYMAGIAKPDFDLSHFVILTTNANTSMEKIHNRMPVLLKKEEVVDYLTSYKYADSIYHRVPYQLAYKPISVSKSNTVSMNKYSQLTLPLE